MRKCCFFLLLLSMVFFLPAQSISKTMLRLPDTGETTSYTSTFGEDNDYSINPPFFIDNSDETVTDTVTGLMWQKTDGGEMTIESALVYCDTLTLAGYTNWRLPNPHESFSILNHQYANPALDASVFTSTVAQYWWTSIRQANDSNKVWATNAGGGIGNHPKTETISAGGNKRFHVRAVREITTPSQIPNHFTDNGDGTITDHLTGLIWQKTPFADTLTWEQALNYADTLSLTGTSDWRLPNIKELRSINDESRINPSLNTTYINAGGVKKYWSSTTLPNQTTKAWYLDTQFGITTYDFKTSGHHLICVRGNVNETTAISEVTQRAQSIIYPNPFQTTISVFPTEAKTHYLLSNSMGQLIYSGQDIEGQDFSFIPDGIYFLYVIKDCTVTYKLIKN